MRTTLELPDEIFASLKLKALNEGKTLKQLLREIVEDTMAPRGASPNIRKREFSGTIVGKTGPVMKEMSNDTIARLEDQ